MATEAKRTNGNDTQWARFERLDLSTKTARTAKFDVSNANNLSVEINDLSDPTPGTFLARVRYSINRGLTWNDSTTTIADGAVSSGSAVVDNIDCTGWTDAILETETALSGLDCVVDMFALMALK